MKGYFSEETLKKFANLAEEQYGLNFSEDGETYDFARCVRSDGTYYGTSGKCRKGTDADPKEQAAPKAPRVKKVATPKTAKTAKPKEEKKNSVHDSLDRVREAIRAKAARNAEHKTAAVAPPDPEKSKKVEAVKAAGAAYSKLLNEQYELSMKGDYDKSLKMGPKVKAAKAKYEKLQEDLKTPAQKAIEKREADDKTAWRKQQDKFDEAQEKTNLTTTQKKAIKDYTGEKSSKDGGRNYDVVNGCLRNPSSCGDKEGSAKFTKELDSAVKALPKNDGGAPFYRGIMADRGDAEKLYNTLENAKPGTTLKDPGFGSYSSSIKQAQHFTTSDAEKKNIIFVSRHKSLTPINMFSGLPEEAEAIMPRGTSQTIRRVSKEGGTLIVEVD